MSGITLKQLAEISGCSIRTVNRVLKNEANVNRDKRELILRLAKERHYVPNMAARNLRMAKKSFIGILCGPGANEVFLQKLNDLERRLFYAGYHPILGQMNKDVNELRSMLNDWIGITDHIIIFPSKPEEKFLTFHETFAHVPVECILIDGEPVCGQHSIRIDRASGVAEAYRYFLETGRRNIYRCGVLQSRAEGIKKALAENPGSSCGTLVCGTEFEDGYSIGNVLVEKKADAVLFDTDRAAMGFLRYAAENRIGIPSQIAVSGFDNDAMAQYGAPPLASIAHPVSRMNEKILEIIQGKTEGVVSAEYPAVFVPRESAGKK